MKRLFPSTIHHQPLTRLRPRHLGYAAIAYIALIIAGALLGAEITLRSKTRWVKGTFVLVGRRGNSVYLPASPETVSKGVVGVVPIRPNRGHAVLGEARLAGTLVRREIQTERGVLPNGSVGWVSTFVYNGTPAQLGIAYESVGIPSEAGPLPSWHIPPEGSERDAVVVVMHGHGGQKAQGLRSLPALRQTGAGVLYATFRNAFGAPATRPGYLTLGDQEAEDLVSALAWARDAGYRRAVLFGYSMGGSIVLSALREHFAPLPLPVVGVILDSPALDWRATIESQARRVGLPAFMARHVGRLVQRIVTRRSGQDFDAVDQLAAAARLSLPALLFHGTRDRTIPVAQADAFAAARPDLVEYHRVEGAKHIRTWNIDPPKYDEALRRFVTSVLQEEGHD